MARCGGPEGKLIAPYAPEIRPLRGTLSFRRGALHPHRGRVNHSGGREWEDGRTTTQGTGVHPSEGALQPLGILAYIRLLCTTREGGSAAPQGAVFSSSDGY